MTGNPAQWTRRQFAQAAAASSMLGWKAMAAAPHDPAGLAFVGSSPADSTSGAIHVFHVSGSRWTAVQTVPAAAPAHLVAHPTLLVLYAVHAVGLWNNLPRGAISAYAIVPATGRLTLLDTQPLSLSATYPRHAAVSPDGRYLLATSERGGLYNLLPIGPDGALETPSTLRKECGLDHGSFAIPKIAAPTQAVFHPDGRTILTADAGQEAISTFSFDHESIRLEHRMCAHPGAGPTQMAITPTGDWLYTQHATDGSIAVHRARAGSDLQPTPAARARHPGPATMAMHPGGRFLVTAGAGTVTSLSIDPVRGHLSERASVRIADPLQLLTCSQDGTHLLGLAPSSGRVLRLAFDASSGALGRPSSVAQVDAASSLLFHPVQL